MVKKDRQSNVELLRIFAIIGVIILHYNNPFFGGGLKYAEEGSLNFYILYTVESLFACAVDLFMLISGYFMCESKKRNPWRPAELIVQVIVFQLAIYLGQVAFHQRTFVTRTFLNQLLPSNYFVILYCAVYFISPWINVMIDRLSEKSFRKLAVMSIALFSVFPTAVDVLGELRGSEVTGLSSVGAYGSQWGYSFVNFLLMYLVGAYLKRGKAKLLTWKTGKLFCWLLINTLLITAWARLNDKVGFFSERSAWEYCNPLIVFEAVLLFVLFSKINIGTNRVINKLAECVFTVFLLHSAFLRYLSVKRFVTGNAVLMVFHMIGSAIGIFLVCWVAHFAYHFVFDRLFKMLSAKIRLSPINADE